jgi:hypothetical protein
MNRTLGGMIALASAMQMAFSINTESRKAKILEEWEKSKSYPRKKKKRVRKELQLDWSIANFDPFNI